MKCNLSPISTNFNGKTKQDTVSSKKMPEAPKRPLSNAMRSLAAYAIGGLMAAGTLSSCSNNEYLGQDPSIYTFRGHGDNWEPKTVNLDPVEFGPDNEIGMNEYLDKQFNQGYDAKNCYFVASMVALANNDLGQQVINNTMTINDDKSVELFDERTPLYRKYSKQDILTADSLASADGIYSRGDRDALPLQMLERELQNGKIGGSTAHALSLITGLDAKVERGDWFSILEESSHNPFKIMTVSIPANRVHDIPCVNGGFFRGQTGPKNGHSLAITGIKNQGSNKTVSIVDPQRNYRTYEITWEDFATQLKPTDITSVDLSKLIG